MKSVVRIGARSKGGRKGLATECMGDRLEIDARAELIQALIPIGLEAVNELLQQEVVSLVGARYSRGGGEGDYARWGRQPGSVYLGDQKVAVTVPRVRDLGRGQEVTLASYQALGRPRRAEEAALLKVLKGLSCRDYEACVDPAAETFGLAASSLSRRFKRASAKKLAELTERDLSAYDLVALFLDGKTFGDDRMVIGTVCLIGLGVTLQGQKVVLGFVQTSTENERACSVFLRGLVDRGLRIEAGLLCVIDGSKGLSKAVDKVLGDKAALQRCQWHKRENVVSYLPVSKQATFRQKLQRAYDQPTYAKAKAALSRIRSELSLLNASAVASLDEGLAETLTLRRLGLFPELGRSFKTTNCIENEWHCRLFDKDLRRFAGQ
ncbi:MAG: transposase [Planctomycetes bacterium]|nr:transposase [Planctomycetota bacterium]